jgi:hypothetical protein
MARRFSKILSGPIIQVQILKVTIHMIVVASFGRG